MQWHISLIPALRTQCRRISESEDNLVYIVRSKPGTEVHNESLSEKHLPLLQRTRVYFLVPTGQLKLSLAPVPGTLMTSAGETCINMKLKGRSIGMQTLIVNLGMGAKKTPRQINHLGINIKLLWLPSGNQIILTEEDRNIKRGVGKVRGEGSGGKGRKFCCSTRDRTQEITTVGNDILSYIPWPTASF